MLHSKILSLPYKCNKSCYFNPIFTIKRLILTSEQPEAGKKLPLLTLYYKESIRKFHVGPYLSGEQKDEYYAKLALKESRNKEIVSKEFFEDKAEKNRETFKNAIDIFNNRDIRKRGSVEFIYAAMKHMKQFDCHRYA